MKKLLLLYFALCLCSLQLVAQRKMPVIKSDTILIHIRDGKEIVPGGWTIMPHLKPDVYSTNSKSGYVIFITDTDSIRFKMKKGAVHNFIVLLNGKDSAWTQIRHEPTYLETLKGAGKYNVKDDRPLPNFRYYAFDDSLDALRVGFKLDSIAGKGNEVSKIINLMHWIHDLVPHDGNHNNPTVMNAMSMIATCKKENRGLNCRGLATVLNECYLAMGFKSRYITCMPKDSVFQDCHVINMVWSKDLGKWLWMDPTNDAYVMDEKGTLLSIEEVRQRLIDGRPLILNPDANWNHITSTTKEEYLYEYMAKNLYRLQCPIVSQYDTETPVDGKKVEYIELLPLDGLQQTPQRSERKSQRSGMTIVDYKTNNPNRFWAVPEFNVR
ncbi:MAG: transglutaminase domain-containing protein [Saprospiraceae bacterium]|nr:transglutaminase domain-containing protein [Saprospiraceae bacterium]